MCYLQDFIGPKLNTLCILASCSHYSFTGQFFSESLIKYCIEVRGSQRKDPKSNIWNVDLSVLNWKGLTASFCPELTPLVLTLNSSFLICVKSPQSIKQKAFIVLLLLIFFSFFLVLVFRLVAMI